MALGWLRGARDYVRDSGERVATLRVRLRADRKAARRRQLVGIGMQAAVVAAAAALLVAGMVWSWRSLFSRNPRFVVTRLDIAGGGAELAAYLRDGKGIGSGANMFGFSMRRVQDEILRNGPQYRSVQITRRLPGEVTVSAVERVPVARIEMPRKRLVVDQDGYVFGPRGGSGALPVITGSSEYELAPGRSVSGMATAAIEVLEACRNPGLGLRVEAVDVSGSEYLLVQLEGRRPIKMLWEGMGRGGEESRKNLDLLIGRLAKTMRASKAAGHSAFDATYPDMIVGQH